LPRPFNRLGRALFGQVTLTSGIILLWSLPTWDVLLSENMPFQSILIAFKEARNYLPSLAVAFVTVSLVVFVRTADALQVPSTLPLRLWLRGQLDRSVLTMVAAMAAIAISVFVPQVYHVFFQVACPLPIAPVKDTRELLGIIGLYVFLLGLFTIYAKFILLILPEFMPADPAAAPEHEATAKLRFSQRVWRRLVEPLVLLGETLSTPVRRRLAVAVIAVGALLWLVRFTVSDQWEQARDSFAERPFRDAFAYLLIAAGIWLWSVPAKVGTKDVPRMPFGWNIFGRALFMLLAANLLGEFIWWLANNTGGFFTNRNYTIWAVLHVLFCLLLVARVVDAYDFYLRWPWRIILIGAVLIALGLLRSEPVGKDLLGEKIRVQIPSARGEIGRYEERDAWPNPSERVDRWFNQFEGRLDELDRLQSDGPAVFVAASGGGSRAAVFAALVFEELARLNVNSSEYEAGANSPTIADHIVLISSVSGGSLATAQYAYRKYKDISIGQQIRELQNSFKGQLALNMQREVIAARDRAERIPGQEGAYYRRQYDAARKQLKVFQPHTGPWLPLTSSYFDQMCIDMMAPLTRGALLPGIERGTSLSRFSERRLGWEDINNLFGFANRQDLAQNGGIERVERVIPLLAINAADVRNGTRLVIGFPAVPPELLHAVPEERAKVQRATEVVDFNPRCHISLAEAVRLSANFPWGVQVGQLVRKPSGTEDLKELDVIDGGVVDNTGLDTITHLFQSLAVLADEEERIDRFISGVVSLLGAPLGANPLLLEVVATRLLLQQPNRFPGPDHRADASINRSSLRHRALRILRRLNRRGVLVIEIDSGLKPQPDSPLATTFPTLFEPLGALDNASYSNANLAKYHNGADLEEALRLGQPHDLPLPVGDKAVFNAVFQCNHAESVMTAWALGPHDKAKILVEHWVESQMKEPLLQHPQKGTIPLLTKRKQALDKAENELLRDIRYREGLDNFLRAEGVRNFQKLIGFVDKELQLESERKAMEIRTGLHDRVAQENAALQSELKSIQSQLHQTQAIADIQATRRQAFTLSQQAASENAWRKQLSPPAIDYTKKLLEVQQKGAAPDQRAQPADRQ
jgi:hypothetical protein